MIGLVHRAERCARIFPHTCYSTPSAPIIMTFSRFDYVPLKPISLVSCGATQDGKLVHKFCVAYHFANFLIIAIKYSTLLRSILLA